jgi:hypothetical protein
MERSLISQRKMERSKALRTNKGAAIGLDLKNPEFESAHRATATAELAPHPSPRAIQQDSKPLS